MDTWFERERQRHRSEFSDDEWMEMNFDKATDELIENLKPLKISFDNIINEIAYAYMLEEDDLKDVAMEVFRD